MFKLNFVELRNPEDVIGGGGSEGLSDFNEEEFLSGDDVNVETEEETSDDQTDDITDDSESQEEEDIEDSEGDDQEDSEDTEEEENQEEESEDSNAPQTLEETTFRDIKAKYPNLFKEFPALKSAFAEAKQFKEVFSNANEAKQVVEEVTEYRELADELSLGSPIGLVKLLSSNKAALRTFSKKILPVLHRVDQDSFYEATTPVISTVLKNVLAKYANGQDQQSKNFTLAAKYISHFVFGDVEPPDFRGTENNNLDPEKQRLIAERENFIQVKSTEFAQGLDAEVKSTVNKLIAPELNKIKGQSKYVMNKLRADIINALDNELNNDADFIRSQRQLFGRAARSGFQDRATASRIKSAYLERANKVVGLVAKRVIKESGLVQSKNPKLKKVGPSASVGANRGSNNNTRNINPRQIDYNRTSDMDILGGNIKLKGQK